MTEIISARRGVKWVGIAQVGKILLQLVSLLTLARLVPASDFGLMALAATATAFAGLMRDMGTGAALIQRSELSNALKDAVFAFNLAVGIVITGILMLSAATLSRLFGEPRLLGVLAWLSPIFTVTAFGAVHQALIERELRFSTGAKIELAASGGGLLIALVVAWNGGGVYSLVAQSGTNAVLSTVMLWYVSPWRPSFRARVSELRKIYGFSSNIVVFGIVNYFHRNTDSVLIGKFVGSTELGVYNMAYRIILFPLQSVTFVVNRALFPVYSRNQGNVRMLGQHYTETLGNIAFITAPMMSLAWAMREPLVQTLLGSQWLPAVGVIAWLSPVGFFQSIVSTSGSVLTSIGRSDVLRNLGLIGVPFLTMSFVAGLRWGAEGVAAAYCIATAIWLFPVIATVLRTLNYPFVAFLANVWIPTICAICVAVVVRAAYGALVAHSAPPMVQLSVGTTLGAATYAFLTMLFMKPLAVRIIVASRPNSLLAR